jgi:hypothetical protein
MEMELAHVVTIDGKQMRRIEELSTALRRSEPLDCPRISAPSLASASGYFRHSVLPATAFAISAPEPDDCYGGQGVASAMTWT